LISTSIIRYFPELSQRYFCRFSFLLKLKTTNVNTKGDLFGPSRPMDTTNENIRQEEFSNSTEISATTKKSRKRKHTTIEYEQATKPAEAPSHWQEIYERIKQMRSMRPAPVDTMGCEALSEKDTLPPPISRFHCLVALLLSAQTHDELTAKAVANLKKLCGRNDFSPQDLLQHTVEEVDTAVHQVNFHTRKAQFLLQICDILVKKYNGDIPTTFKDILDLPGIGSKMAHILMYVGWGTPVGIGVDRHVHRICNRLGWAHSNNPETTRTQLQRWLPKEYWGPINKLFVGFGQTICTHNSPHCHECLVNDLCPSAFRECKLKQPKSLFSSSPPPPSLSTPSIVTTLNAAFLSTAVNNTTSTTPSSAASATPTSSLPPTAVMTSPTPVSAPTSDGNNSNIKKQNECANSQSSLSK
jgi:endonuclease-3